MEGGPDAGALAEKVRTFYERHPYPPPAGDLDGYRRAWQDRERRRADHHLFWPALPYSETASVLIAGCGTSQAAKHALRWPAARVTAIDFSATSVGCTEELKRRYDLSNLEVRQLSVEQVGELGTSFDQIVCTGVLHHLADPDAGLAALRDVLAPGGAMHLMVYAPYGRTGVYMLQDLFRRLDIAPTSAGLEEVAAALKLLPRDHPLAALLRAAPDFQDDAGIADALLHPRDRAYSVPELFAFLEDAGLAFGRWVQQAPYSHACGAPARLPDGTRARLAGLAPPDRYAAVELFRGTMLRHSAVVYRDTAQAAAQRIDFSGDAFAAYVPIRAPHTLSVRERLPPGAAAVLINRSHAHTDIFLPIDAREERLLAAADGQRSIAEIAGSPASLPATGAFFERLYAHDQVVFDASAPRAAR